MSKSLRRLDVVRDANTELDTQSSTVTFKPAQAIDFKALAAAVDKAGFKASSITIWAKGALSATPDGGLIFTVSGSHQTFPIAEPPEAAKQKAMVGKEMPIVARVQFDDTPPRLVIVEEPKAGMGDLGGMKGMAR